MYTKQELVEAAEQAALGKPAKLETMIAHLRQVAEGAELTADEKASLAKLDAEEKEVITEDAIRAEEMAKFAKELKGLPWETDALKASAGMAKLQQKASEAAAPRLETRAKRIAEIAAQKAPLIEKQLLAVRGEFGRAPNSGSGTRETTDPSAPIYTAGYLLYTKDGQRVVLDKAKKLLAHNSGSGKQWKTLEENYVYTSPTAFARRAAGWGKGIGFSAADASAYTNGVHPIRPVTETGTEDGCISLATLRDSYGYK